MCVHPDKTMLFCTKGDILFRASDETISFGVTSICPVPDGLAIDTIDTTLFVVVFYASFT